VARAHLELFEEHVKGTGTRDKGLGKELRRLRVAIVADYLEEGWPSMDLVADMLFDRLQREHRASIAPTLVRPSMRRRATRLPGVSGIPWLPMIDRLANRMWDYPRIMATLHAFDLYHIVDHSYAHLVHRLPADRTVVTCHDLDVFRCVLDPALEPRSPPFRAMTRRILDGVRSAGHVACDSAATRDALVTKAGVQPDRTSIVHNGPHPSCSPTAEPAADFDAARLLGPRGAFTDLLHVGSTIQRKRIDVLLRLFESLRGMHRQLRLIRVGGPLTAAQRTLARELDVVDAIVEMPTLDRSTLAAVYRRCALLLMPSEREGFGLPVLEALACGTPVVASDIAALKEVGGFAIAYCPVQDIEAWQQTVSRLLDERSHHAEQWTLRREAGIRRAAAFSWSRYALEIAGIYAQVVDAGARC
jgi:glycosyltransferase involved in cell wall biosynthesis